MDFLADHPEAELGLEMWIWKLSAPSSLYALAKATASRKMIGGSEEFGGWVEGLIGESGVRVGKGIGGARARVDVKLESRPEQTGVWKVIPSQSTDCSR